MRGTISRDHWDVPVDLYFYRDPEELKNEDVVVHEEPVTVVPEAAYKPDPSFETTQNWDASTGADSWDAAVPQGMSGF